MLCHMSCIQVKWKRRDRFLQEQLVFGIRTGIALGCMYMGVAAGVLEEQRKVWGFY